MKINIDILLTFLTNRGWEIKENNDKFVSLKAPVQFSFPENYLFRIPHNRETVDFDRFLSNAVEIIAEIYELRIDDLIKIVENESEVFSLRIADQNTTDGSISFKRFEILLEKIMGLLISTASFVISKDPLFAKSLSESEQYLNHCTFLQTEKGSFISKINLPTKESLVEQTLFGDDTIYARDINQRIKMIISYLNNEIFSGNDLVIDYEYIQANRDLINLKLLKQFEELYSKVEIKDIEFSFDSVVSSEKFFVNDMNQQKLDRLDSFIKHVDEILNAEVNMVVTGRIIALRSRNPDGTTNSVKVIGTTEQLLPVTISANLSSEDYKRALGFHSEKAQVMLIGLAKKEKKEYRYLRVDSFEALE